MNILICRHCRVEIQRGWEFNGGDLEYPDFYTDETGMWVCHPEVSNQNHEPEPDHVD